MKLPWFKRIGIIFIPRNIAGLIIMLAVIAFAVYRFIIIDRGSHSASDTLRPFLISLIIIYIAYTLIAFLTGLIARNNKNQHS